MSWEADSESVVPKPLVHLSKALMSEPASLTVPKVQVKPDYGLDYPVLVQALAIGGVIAVVGGSITLPDRFEQYQTALLSLQFSGAFALVQAALLTLSSYYGKIRERDRIVQSLVWEGTENVLDIGCGRGLLLIGAAKQLTKGKALGIDIWNSAELSDNWAEATWDNVVAEGLEAKIEVRDGDVREMPVADGTIDVILSQFGMSTLVSAFQRQKAAAEIVRVMRPGGRFALLEWAYSKDLVKQLKEAGAEGVSRSSLRFTVFPPARLITGTKSLLPPPTE